jgi:hypothetical protein
MHGLMNVKLANIWNLFVWHVPVINMSMNILRRSDNTVEKRWWGSGHVPVFPEVRHFQILTCPLNLKVTSGNLIQWRLYSVRHRALELHTWPHKIAEFQCVCVRIYWKFLNIFYLNFPSEKLEKFLKTFCIRRYVKHMHNSESICFLLLPAAVGIALFFLIGPLCMVLKIGHFEK